MLEKFDFYDLMSSLIPGALIVGLIGVLFPVTCSQLVPDGDTAFSAITLTALIIFVGQLLVAAGSIVEPLLFYTWGGKPSDQALTKGLGDRYMPYHRAQRIKTKLQSMSEHNASSSSLFLKAMTLARNSQNNLAERFNALYAYQRTLVVLILASFVLITVSRFEGILNSVSEGKFWFGVSVLAVILLVCWQRAKQRAYYFVREVLMSAEREMDEQADPTCDKS